jgi:hypothetical protein
MAKMIWLFKQKDYIHKYGLKGQEDGVCLALAARWAKMRLKYQDAVGNEDAGSRTIYFEGVKKIGKSTVSAVISEMQASYDDVRAPAKVESNKLAALVDDAFEKSFINEITQEAYKSIKSDAEAAADLLEKKVSNAEDVLFARQKLVVVSRNSCNSFLEYFDGVQDKSCYVFKCKDLKHAFASYYQKGLLWDDYYLFDPNCGEIYMDGSSQMKDLMGQLKKHFGVNGRADRIRVRYERASHA